MKKFFPSILIALTFTILMIAQMVMNGRKLEASKIKEEKSKYSAFETQFQKIQLKTTKGTEYKLDKVKQPVVILNFWASWCLPCLQEFQSLTKFVDTLPKDKVLVIGINNDDENPKKSIIKTEKEYKLNFESVSDFDSSITGQFYISKIPASIVFYNGSVIQFTNQEMDFMNDEFVMKIKKLITN